MIFFITKSIFNVYYRKTVIIISSTFVIDLHTYKFEPIDICTNRSKYLQFTAPFLNEDTCTEFSTNHD